MDKDSVALIVTRQNRRNKVFKLVLSTVVGEILAFPIHVYTQHTNVGGAETWKLIVNPLRETKALVIRDLWRARGEKLRAKIQGCTNHMKAKFLKRSIIKLMLDWIQGLHTIEMLVEQRHVRVVFCTLLQRANYTADVAGIWDHFEAFFR